MREIHDILYINAGDIGKLDRHLPDAKTHPTVQITLGRMRRKELIG